MKRIILICMVVALIFAVAGCTEPQSTVAEASSTAPVETSIAPEMSEPAPEPEPKPEPAWESLDDLLASHEWTTEAGTTDRVDEIVVASMLDCTEVSEGILEQAIEFIASNYHDFFVDAETMENLMYCGSLLDSAYNSQDGMLDYAKLGMDTLQAIKYVYRGIEEVDDEATVSNLSQVKESLVTLEMDGTSRTMNAAFEFCEDAAVSNVIVERHPDTETVVITIELTEFVDEADFAIKVAEYAKRTVDICDEYGVAATGVEVTAPLENDSWFPDEIKWKSYRMISDEMPNSEMLFGAVYDDRINESFYQVPYDGVAAVFSSEEYAKAVRAAAVVWHGGGTYKIGADIEAGEYIVKNTSSGRSTYIAIKTDSSDSLDSILSNENFDGYYFVTLSDGQYFEVSRGDFALANTVEIEFDCTALDEGLYRVGVDIPAGEYKCIASDPDRYGYYCVYSSNSGKFPISSNDLFDGSSYVTVYDGQYLYVNRATASLVS